MLSSVTSAARPDLLAAPMEGIRRGMNQLTQAADNIARGDVSPENVVQEMQAEILVKANVVSARTAQDVLGTLLDTVA